MPLYTSKTLTSFHFHLQKAQLTNCKARQKPPSLFYPLSSPSSPIYNHHIIYRWETDKQWWMHQKSPPLLHYAGSGPPFLVPIGPIPRLFIYSALGMGDCMTWSMYIFRSVSFIRRCPNTWGKRPLFIYSILDMPLSCLILFKCLMVLNVVFVLH